MLQGRHVGCLDRHFRVGVSCVFFCRVL
jgi:hypothetical protein